MKAGRLFSMCIALVLLAAVSVAAASTPLASPCMPGSAYDPACDVDHNGTINVTDIQLAAGHWGQTGTYTETALSDSTMPIELFGHCGAYGTFTVTVTGLSGLSPARSMPTGSLRCRKHRVPAGAQRYFRIETWFDGKPCRALLRMRDPANESD